MKALLLIIALVNFSTLAYAAEPEDNPAAYNGDLTPTKENPSSTAEYTECTDGCNRQYSQGMRENNRAKEIEKASSGANPGAPTKGLSPDKTYNQ